MSSQVRSFWSQVCPQFNGAFADDVFAARYNMHHPHVVQTRAVIETADWVFIVMELLEGGELQKNIEERRSYAKTDAAEVMLRLGLTLGFLHSQGAWTDLLCLRAS